MSWKRQVQAYDDDALTQLGSTGLLRRARKQLESGNVRLHSEDDGQGTFAVGAQQVTLLNAPLEESQCDCNASGVCVHIIAAVLHTREIAAAPNEDTHPAAPNENSAPNEDTQHGTYNEDTQHLKGDTRTASEEGVSNEDTHHSEVVSGQSASNEDTNPSNEDTNPSNEDTNPSNEDTNPSNEDTHNPSNEDTHHSEVLEEGTRPNAPSEELAAHSLEAVMKWAGKPGTRLAARLLATLPADQRRIEEKQTTLEIILDNEVRCRYILGAGLDGILCDAPESRRKGVIAACLLHWQQHQGRAVDWPGDAEPARAEGPLSSEESALVREVCEQLKRMLDAGLMHLPREHVNALRTLAWSARGESLPRLSGLLLRFVGEIAAFRDKTAGADSQQIFDLLTSVWVLCEGLLNADARHIQALRGRFRRDYSAQAVGPLWSCGAYRYRSPSGAQGLSVILWDLDSRQVLRLNMGRTGEGAGAFNPYTLWQSVIPWAKGRSPESINGKVLGLENARVSGDGRLSQSRETVLQSVDGPSHFADAINQLGFFQWDELSKLMEAGLENEDALMPPLIIRPREVKAFQVAEHDQRWIGWAKDTNKKWLRLSAPVDNIHNARIAAINKLVAQTPNPWGMVLEPRRDQDALSLVPVAVIVNKGDDWVCFNPDLQSINPKDKNRVRSWLRQVLGSDAKTPSDEPIPAEFPALAGLLNDARQLLLGAAEIGLDSRYIRADQLKRLTQTLHDAHALNLAQVLEQLGDNPAHAQLIKAHHAFRLAWRKFQVMEKIS